MLDALYQDYEARGFMLVTILSLGDADMQKQWAGEYGFPVLLDADGSVQARWDRDGAQPSFHLIAPGVEMVVQDESPDNTQIEGNLPG